MGDAIRFWIAKELVAVGVFVLFVVLAVVLMAIVEWRTDVATRRGPNDGGGDGA